MAFYKAVFFYKLLLQFVVPESSAEIQSTLLVICCGLTPSAPGIATLQAASLKRGVIFPWIWGGQKCKSPLRSHAAAHAGCFFFFCLFLVFTLSSRSEDVFLAGKVVMSWLPPESLAVLLIALLNKPCPRLAAARFAYFSRIIPEPAAGHLKNGGGCDSVEQADFCMGSVVCFYANKSFKYLFIVIQFVTRQRNEKL